MEIPVFIEKKAEILAAKVDARQKDFTIDDLKAVIKLLDETDAEILTRAIRCKNMELFYGVFEVVISQYLQGEVK